LPTQMSLSHPNDAVRQIKVADRGFRLQHKNGKSVVESSFVKVKRNTRLN
jgi:hypothetical protein